MKVVVQRVACASVTVEGTVVGAIERGLLLLVGFGAKDGAAERQWMAKKCVGLRIFSDENGRMNRSVRDIEGGVLAVSQFTLYGDATKGNRTSFVSAAPPEEAKAEYLKFCDDLSQHLGRPVQTGRFGADMKVDLQGDGPVTILLERNASISM